MEHKHTSIRCALFAEKRLLHFAGEAPGGNEIVDPGPTDGAESTPDIIDPAQVEGATQHALEAAGTDVNALQQRVDAARAAQGETGAEGQQGEVEEQPPEDGGEGEGTEQPGETGPEGDGEQSPEGGAEEGAEGGGDTVLLGAEDMKQVEENTEVFKMLGMSEKDAADLAKALQTLKILFDNLFGDGKADVIAANTDAAGEGDGGGKGPGESGEDDAEGDQEGNSKSAEGNPEKRRTALREELDGGTEEDVNELKEQKQAQLDEIDEKYESREKALEESIAELEGQGEELDGKIKEAEEALAKAEEDGVDTFDMELELDDLKTDRKAIDEKIQSRKDRQEQLAEDKKGEREGPEADIKELDAMLEAAKEGVALINKALEGLKTMVEANADKLDAVAPDFRKLINELSVSVDVKRNPPIALGLSDALVTLGLDYDIVMEPDADAFAEDPKQAVAQIGQLIQKILESPKKSETIEGDSGDDNVEGSEGNDTIEGGNRLEKRLSKLKQKEEKLEKKLNEVTAQLNEVGDTDAATRNRLLGKMTRINARLTVVERKIARVQDKIDNQDAPVAPAEETPSPDDVIVGDSDVIVGGADDFFGGEGDEIVSSQNGNDALSEGEGGTDVISDDVDVIEEDLVGSIDDRLDDVVDELISGESAESAQSLLDQINADLAEDINSLGDDMIREELDNLSRDSIVTESGNTYRIQFNYDNFDQPYTIVEDEGNPDDVS